MWSFGLRTGGVELVLAETVGCKVHIFDGRKDSVERFEKIQTLLKNHSYEATDPSWCESVSKTTVLPERLLFSSTLPGSYTGQLDISGNITNFKAMNINETARVDFVKIDYPDLEAHIVYQILHTGYRPGIVLIHWNHNPDEFTESMLAAAHLQNSGYRLVSVDNGYFLYVFTDKSIYEICSWQVTTVENPMYDELKKGFLNFFTTPKAEGSSK